MSDKKLTYPKGIYANRYPDTPSFVFANIKIDCARAIQELQSCDQPYLLLQVLRSREPDDKGNVAFVAIDDFKMEGQRQRAAKGIDQAKAAVTAPPKNRPVEATFPEDDIPF